MSKRRINKQQSARIQKIQASYRDITNDSSQNEDGLVITRFSQHAEIEDKQRKRIHCSIRPNIDSLVAGDKVIWHPIGDNQGVVVSRYPRTSVLKRPNKRQEDKPVAANITQVMIVVAPKPELSWSLLDSYLVMAENLKLAVTIIFNKVDLPCEKIKEELKNCYEALGYSILLISKHDLQGYHELQQALLDHTSVFVGQSGVGKSSLIAGLLPHETKIQVADISTLSELGCHTTSNSYFYHLPRGGALIDSPGVREFGLWRMPMDELIYGFREFRLLAAECKFRNCNHQHTPGCALIHAIKEGHISERRYENLIKIIKSYGHNA